MSEEDIDAFMKEREAKTRAKLLEIIGDLPDADMAPPENVLFVCKLNSVTNDDDLELIFSRFGKINSCEVIRDSKTGDSLCYAFIEFDRQQDCESAYFKMDNVLIDDRRIHVDFSQSVSKISQWRGKGTGTGYFEDKKNFNPKLQNNETDETKPIARYKINDNRSKRGSNNNYDLVFDDHDDDKNSNRRRHNDHHDDEDIKRRKRDTDRHDKYKRNDKYDRDRERHHKSDRDKHHHHHSHNHKSDRHYKRDRSTDKYDRDRRRD
jgi:peptidyl-prolyl cis-trans isomerase-like 4